jgi:hypothetical protein
VLRPDHSYAPGLCARTVILLVAFTLTGAGSGGELGGSGPLRHLTIDELAAILPQGTALMMRADAVEEFLMELDEQPPDWTGVYGHGHHDPGHDDRLFALNRERDAKREGKPALSKPVAFAWSGTLSGYDASIGGYPVAIGPKFIKTSWGMVRFKPEDAPGNLSVASDDSPRIQVQHLLEQDQPVEIDVVMTGRLLPEESIVYDFSHDEEGLGLIMPFVKVERIDFVMPKSLSGQ